MKHDGTRQKAAVFLVSELIISNVSSEKFKMYVQTLCTVLDDAKCFRISCFQLCFNKMKICLNKNLKKCFFTFIRFCFPEFLLKMFIFVKGPLYVI